MSIRSPGFVRTPNRKRYLLIVSKQTNLPQVSALLGEIVVSQRERTGRAVCSRKYVSALRAAAYRAPHTVRIVYASEHTPATHGSA